jgi:hypothetical protein
MFHLGIVVFSKVLNYSQESEYMSVPWMCCRFEVEGEASNHRFSEEADVITDFLKEEIFPKLPFKPFKDEDAYKLHFSRPQPGGYADILPRINSWGSYATT